MPEAFMTSLDKESIKNIFLDYRYFGVLWGNYNHHLKKKCVSDNMSADTLAYSQ